MKQLVRITSSPNWIAENFCFGILREDRTVTPIKIEQAVKKLGWPKLVQEWPEAKFSADNLDSDFETVQIDKVPKWAQSEVRQILG